MEKEITTRRVFHFQSNCVTFCIYCISVWCWCCCCCRPMAMNLISTFETNTHTQTRFHSDAVTQSAIFIELSSHCSFYTQNATFSTHRYKIDWISSDNNCVTSSPLSETRAFFYSFFSASLLHNFFFSLSLHPISFPL